MHRTRNNKCYWRRVVFWNDMGAGLAARSGQTRRGASRLAQVEAIRPVRVVRV
jgi:hypothetical protein